MRATPLLAALLLAFGSAHAQSAMNYAYQVTGDPQARPIQAFDDGQKLYVQFRDVNSPPAPIGAGGPLSYTIRGPYLVLPIVQSVQLRYGPFSAWVRAEGAADAAPGVVSVSRPVEVPIGELSAPVAAPAARPVASMSPMIVTPPASGVSGEIVAVGEAGTRKAAEPTAAPAPVSASGARTITFEEARDRSSFADFAGKRVVIRADGTSAGASAAIAARGACAANKTTGCFIEYRGAPSGQLFIAEKN